MRNTKTKGNVHGIILNVLVIQWTMLSYVVIVDQSIPGQSKLPTRSEQCGHSVYISILAGFETFTDLLILGINTRHIHVLF